MNPEIKQKWVEALRSGKYKQAKGALRDEKDRFCCLGVLCDITQTTKRKWKHGDWGWEMQKEISELPPSVSRIAKLHGTDPFVEYKGEMACLSVLNDRGVRFSTIAKLIEEQL